MYHPSRPGTPAVQPAQLNRRVDIEHEQPARLQRVVYAPKCFPAVIRAHQIIETVKRADDRVGRLCQTQPLHRLADKKWTDVLRQVPCLLFCLSQHFLRQICTDHPVSVLGQQHGQRTRPAGQIQNQMRLYMLPRAQPLKKGQCLFVSDIVGQFVVAGRKRFICAHACCSFCCFCSSSFMRSKMMRYAPMP